MSKMGKKTCMILTLGVFNYIEKLLEPMNIMLHWFIFRKCLRRIRNLYNFCRNEIYMSVIKKEKERHDKIKLLERIKLNTTEVSVSKALSDSEISFDEFLYVSNVLKEHNVIKQPIKYPNSNKLDNI